MTSPVIPMRASELWAFRTQVSSVSASFRQGSTTLNSTAPIAGTVACSESAGDGAEGLCTEGAWVYPLDEHCTRGHTAARFVVHNGTPRKSFALAASRRASSLS